MSSLNSCRKSNAKSWRWRDEPRRSRTKGERQKLFPRRTGQCRTETVSLCLNMLEMELGGMHSQLMASTAHPATLYPQARDHSEREKYQPDLHPCAHHNQTKTTIWRLLYLLNHPSSIHLQPKEKSDLLSSKRSKT